MNGTHPSRLAAGVAYVAALLLFVAAFARYWMHSSKDVPTYGGRS
jgi:hypothetical protein